MHSALTANYKAYLLKRREMCLNRQIISKICNMDELRMVRKDTDTRIRAQKGCRIRDNTPRKSSAIFPPKQKIKYQKKGKNNGICI